MLCPCCGGPLFYPTGKFQSVCESCARLQAEQEPPPRTFEDSLAAQCEAVERTSDAIRLKR